MFLGRVHLVSPFGDRPPGNAMGNPGWRPPGFLTLDPTLVDNKLQVQRWPEPNTAMRAGGRPRHCGTLSQFDWLTLTSQIVQTVINWLWLLVSRHMRVGKALVRKNFEAPKIHWPSSRCLKCYFPPQVRPWRKEAIRLKSVIFFGKNTHFLQLYSDFLRLTGLCESLRITSLHWNNSWFKIPAGVSNAEQPVSEIFVATLWMA